MINKFLLSSKCLSTSKLLTLTSSLFTRTSSASFRTLQTAVIRQQRFHTITIDTYIGSRPLLVTSSYQSIRYLSKNSSTTTSEEKSSSSSKSATRENSKMPPVEKSAVALYVENLLGQNKIVVFSKTTCPFCVKVKDLFKDMNQEFVTVELDTVENGEEIKKYLIEETKHTTVPNVFINGSHIGGYDSTLKAQKDGSLEKMLTQRKTKEEPSDDNNKAPIVLKPKQGESIESFVNEMIKSHKTAIFSKTTCPFCAKVKELFKSLNEQYAVVELDQIDEGPAIRDLLFERTGQKTVPNVYVRGVHLGGCDNTLNAHAEGRLARLLAPEQVVKEAEEKYDYDLIVIGGGSGGLACSKTAADLGAKVAVLDFVKPTPIGTTWGLGGTCVNVGCIPKKLMHQSALLGEGLHHSREYGWQTPENITHNWETMRENIQNYIGSLNFNYRVQLRDKKVDYLNAYGTFIDKHKILTTNKAGKTKEITGKYICVAVGGRPKYPEDIKGAREYSITSDDLFSLPYNPGKTLCVGASYVSLECAGFLKAIGLDVTVMVRSILLRGFDQQMANIIGDYMESQAGVKFIRGSIPVEIVKIKDGEPGEYLVKYKNENGELLEETYNTIVLAVGRDPCTSDLNLDKVGVKLNPKNKKILTTFEQTSTENIYAIGDVIDESSANNRVLELTPVAIKAGQLLANRLFGSSDVKMDYNAVPTTVFTPIEYGAIGFSEEEAIQAIGEENLEVFHTQFWPLEWTVAHKPHDVCYAKLICNKLDKERVIGLHVAGPNAGEITQGYAVAIKLRATKKDFDMTVGIHPTCSETFTTLNVTKASGKDIGGAGC